jgi:DNA polymerase I-like protein with 3'-5' exonuclease and polymerase domains
MLISLDTETTGLDLYHDARPFLVTVTTDEGKTLIWRWDVDPLTRHPVVRSEDVDEIRDVISSASEIVLHNTKFDYTALHNWLPGALDGWDWAKVQDTLIAGHLLASNEKHDLTSMAMHYLAREIQPYEKALHEAAERAHRLCRTRLPEWKIASKLMEGHPSMTKELWRADGWLPRALCLWAQQQLKGYVPQVKLLKNGQPSKHQPRAPWWHEFSGPDHPWLRVLTDYANADSTATLELWKVLRRELVARDNWAMYRHQMRLVPITCSMESRGITLSGDRLGELEGEYEEDARTLADTCVGVARKYDYDLHLPKTGNNDSLKELLFDRMHLPVVLTTKKTGSPSLNEKAMSIYEERLERNSLPLLFIRSLKMKRKRDTALNFLRSYRRFWKPSLKGFYRLHPNINVTGTDTLRWSFSNPNSANISTQGMPCPACYGEGCDYCNDEGLDPRSLRYALGPMPGREWWSLDARNIELRIPAYKSGEKEMIELFEHPDDPPYYGSNHLLNFSAVYSEIWQRVLDMQIKDRNYIKKKFLQVYKRCKNGGFSKQYGGQKKKVDDTFGVEGAYELMAARFAKLEALNQSAINEAKRKGYVETYPFESIHPTRGYPLLIERSEWGGIVPTKPLNYKVQGTAMLWTDVAMVRVQDQLDDWSGRDGFDGFITIQQHDEIVLDFPRRGDPVADAKQEKEKGRLPLFRTAQSSNLWRIRIIQDLMEEGGRDALPI